MTYSSNAAEVLDALGDPTRRAVLELLRDGPRAVGDIASELPVSRPAVSQHLRVLKGAGLVTERKDGTRQEVKVLLRIDTPIEVDYYRHGGIMPYVLRELLAAA